MTKRERPSVGIERHLACTPTWTSRLNSQSLAMCLAPEKCLGGRAWPNVIPQDSVHEIPLLLWGKLHTWLASVLVDGLTPAGWAGDSHDFHTA